MWQVCGQIMVPNTVKDQKSGLQGDLNENFLFNLCYCKSLNDKLHVDDYIAIT